MKEATRIERRTALDASAKERRYLPNEVRASDLPESRSIVGYCSVFEQYADMGWYLEIVSEGAFENAKFERACCLVNHDESLLLGRTSNLTLVFSADAAGLKYDCDVAPTSVGSDLLALVRRKDIFQSSFGFTVRKTTWSEVDRATLAGIVPDAVLDRVSYGGKVEVRRIEEVGEVWDASPVTWPAYEGATVGVRKGMRDEERGMWGANLDLRLRLMEMEMQMTA